MNKELSSALTTIVTASAEFFDALSLATKDERDRLTEYLSGRLKDNAVEQPIWQALLSAVQHADKIRSDWKTGEGVWYATADVFEWSEGKLEGTGQTIEYIKCDGKEAAVKAGRKLLAKHAAKFDHWVTVEATIYPESEWNPSKLPEDSKAVHSK